MIWVWSIGICFYRISMWYFISVVYKVFFVNCDFGVFFIEIVDIVLYLNVFILFFVIYVLKFYGSCIKVLMFFIIIFGS